MNHVNESQVSPALSGKCMPASLTRREAVMALLVGGATLALGMSAQPAEAKVQNVKYYTYKFQGNGANNGASAAFAAKVASGKAFRMPVNPFKKSGYVFVRWEDTRNARVCESLYPGEISYGDCDHVFKARWTKKTRRVAIYPGAGKGSKSSVTVNFKEGKGSITKKIGKPSSYGISAPKGKKFGYWEALDKNGKPIAANGYIDIHIKSGGKAEIRVDGFAYSIYALRAVWLWK